MQKHIKTYIEYFGYCEGEYMPCEAPNCDEQVVDIHHIVPRSKFGSKRKEEQDRIENLIGLCRDDHDKAHSNPMFNESLKIIVSNRS